MTRILGLDIGSVRIGVALSDPLGIIAQPLEVIDRRRADAVERIAALVSDHEVTRLVIGRPVRLDGADGLAVQATETFVDALRQRLGGDVPIAWWDERLTTRVAERAMIQGGVRRKTRRENIDKVAAALILQSYLDARHP